MTSVVEPRTKSRDASARGSLASRLLAYVPILVAAALLALLPLRCQAPVTSIAVSTTCVPAGPSNRDQSW